MGNNLHPFFVLFFFIYFCYISFILVVRDCFYQLPSNYFGVRNDFQPFFLVLQIYDRFFFCKFISFPPFCKFVLLVDCIILNLDSLKVKW
jgi:hypothetical protein